MSTTVLTQKVLPDNVVPLKFEVKPLHKKSKYYGFTLRDSPYFLMPDNTIHHNSGKSVLEQSIVGHASRYEDRFQLVGVDVKRVEFCSCLLNTITQ